MCVQQPRDAMQGDGGFAAARHALHDQRRLHGMADHEVLLCLNGRDDLSKLVRGELPQHALQIRVLTDYAAVEQTQQLPVMDGEHPLEGHFTFHRAVRCGVGHGADLPRIIQVRHGGAPVHHHRVKAGAGHHAPASQIVRFLRTARRNEVQPRKIGLMRGLAQLAQDIQLHAENVQRYQLVRGRVLRHGDLPVFLRTYAGFLFQLVDFRRDHVAGGLQMRVFRRAFGMVGKRSRGHGEFAAFLSVDAQGKSKKPLLLDGASNRHARKSRGLHLRNASMFRRESPLRVALVY